MTVTWDTDGACTMEEELEQTSSHKYSEAKDEEREVKNPNASSPSWGT